MRASSNEGGRVTPAFEKIQHISDGIADRIDVRSRIQQSHGVSRVLRNDQRPRVALTAEVPAYDAYLIHIWDREFGSCPVAVHGVIHARADICRLDRGASQSGGPARFCDRPTYGQAAHGQPCASLRSASYGNAVGVHGSAEVNNFSSRINFSCDNLRDGSVNIGARAGLQIGELRQIRNGGGPGGGAGWSIN